MALQFVKQNLLIRALSPHCRETVVLLCASSVMQSGTDSRWSEEASEQRES